MVKWRRWQLSPPTGCQRTQRAMSRQWVDLKLQIYNISSRQVHVLFLVYRLGPVNVVNWNSCVKLFYSHITSAGTKEAPCCCWLGVGTNGADADRLNVGNAVEPRNRRTPSEQHHKEQCQDGLCTYGRPQRLTKCNGTSKGAHRVPAWWPLPITTCDAKKFLVLFFFFFKCN